MHGFIYMLSSVEKMKAQAASVTALEIWFTNKVPVVQQEAE